jgi:hypothetical protein
MPTTARAIAAGQRRPGQEIACTAAGYPIGDLTELAIVQVRGGVRWRANVWLGLAATTRIVVRDAT